MYSNVEGASDACCCLLLIFFCSFFFSFFSPPPPPSPAVMEADEDRMKDHLRLQFQALQEQQVQRLQERLEKKKQISFQTEKDEVSSNGQNSLDLSEDEGDSVLERSESSSRLLKKDNHQLQEQVRELQDENARLHKLLSEKEFEIKYLKKKREEDRLALVGEELRKKNHTTRLVLSRLIYRHSHVPPLWLEVVDASACKSLTLSFKILFDKQIIRK